MDTFGWDTAAVVRVDQVNRQLELHASELPLDFAADPRTDPPVTATGRFAPWRIVPGGAEQIVYVALPIERGTLSVGSGTPAPEILDAFPYRRSPQAEAMALVERDLAGTTVVVAMDLRLLNSAGPDGKQELVFNIEQVGSEGSPRGDGYVTPVTVVDPAGTLSVAEKSLLGYAIVTDLVARADEVKYVLARVNPVPPATDSWLAPTASKYAYVERETGGDGSLAILSVTGGRDPSGLQQRFDPATLRGDATQSYVISQDMILEHVLLPALPTAYSTDASAFRFDAAGHAVRQARTFGTFSVKSGAITYHPEITSFELRIAGDALRTTLRGTCDLKAGLEMTFSMTVVNAARFDVATKTLTFAPDPSPDISHKADVPWYLAFLSPIAYAIAEICVKVISNDIAGKVSDLTRSALAVVRDPPQIVEWAGDDGFAVQQAGLDSALYMMGRPVAADLRDAEERPATELVVAGA